MEGNPLERLRRAASLRGDAPTEPMPAVGALRGTPYRDPRVTRSVAEEREARAVMDLALRVGESLIENGAGAPGVEAAVIAVATSAGLERFEVDITMQSLLMQSVTPSGQLITRLRVVKATRRDFARLSQVHALVDDLATGRIDFEQASHQIQRIRSARRTWSGWVITVATGLLSASVTLGFGAGWQAVLFSAFSGMLVNRLVRWLGKKGLPDFYTMIAGGLAATIVAWLAFIGGRSHVVTISSAEFAYVVAGGIVALLPARSLTSALEDLIMGYSVTGTARFFADLFHLLGLITGVAAGLAFGSTMAQWFGLALDAPSLSRITWASAPVEVRLIAAAITGTASAIVTQSARRMLAPTALLSIMTVFIAGWLGSVGVGRIAAVSLAAVVLGFVARYLALRMRAPAIVLSINGSLALLPGLSIFVGLQRIVGVSEAGAASGASLLFTSLGIILALAAGTVLGEFFASPLDHTALDRARRARAAQREQSTADRPVKRPSASDPRPMDLSDT
ncbi:threonine/serine ThrE exporter family protein [Kribbia dieselivorans]|uniref:threonine/serine ThrE exporter family protein n=1 Tax=Kribbia dieselivorans TaxID=331526 RepID=UPI000838019E|nr:threonine/serine exporter family protein [Kribbia dieselivorans]